MIKTKTVERQIILDAFTVDINNGKIYWLRPRYSSLVGVEAGRVNHGYRFVRFKVDKKFSTFSSHRIIFFIATGLWPEQIDHVNGIKTDNRIENLRITDHRRNQQNRWHQRAGSLVGTDWLKGKKRWRAQIQINKKRITLGTYHTAQEAHERYLKALKDFNV